MTLLEQRKASYAAWKNKVKAFCRSNRGMQSELARYLGCRRQNVNRWLFRAGGDFPAWAVVHANIWFSSVSRSGDKPVVPPQADNGEGES